MQQEIEVVLANWIANLSFERIAKSTLQTALSSLTDCIGVALAGTRSDVYRRARSSLVGASGACSVLGQPFRAAPGDAAFLNGVAAHAYDFDDTCFAGITHASAVVLPAVLAAVQHQGECSGANLLTSFVAGVETACRLGLAFTDELYYRGHWNTGLLGVVGAAAAVSRVLGLSPDQTAHALRLAMNFPIGLRVILGSNSKPYLCGAAARTGLECAYAARAGIQGQPYTAEGPMGFVQVINQGVLARERLRDGDAPYCMDDPGVAFKFFPICSAGQAAAQAVLALRATHKLTADQIASVTCHATELVIISLRYPQPKSMPQTQFSMQFAVACCMLYGDIGLAQLESDARERPEIKAFMAKVLMVQDDALVVPTQRLRNPEATRVVICLHDGRKLEHTVLAACGMPDSPPPPGRLQRKFTGCATPVLGKERSKQLLTALGQLPEETLVGPTIRIAETGP